MEDFLDFFGLFILVAIIVIVNKAKKAGKGYTGKSHGGSAAKPLDAEARSRQTEQAYADYQNRSKRLDEARQAAAYQRTLKSKDSATARSNYGHSAAAFDSSLRAAASSAGHNVSTGHGLRATTTLRDDREGDWLAQQLRYERRVKASTDLGAVHDANCDARSLKREHLAVHGKY